MATGFRLNQLSPKVLVAGVLVLLGTPVALFSLVYFSDAPTSIAFWGAVALLYYFVFGAYLHARYGGEWRKPSDDEP